MTKTEIRKMFEAAGFTVLDTGIAKVFAAFVPESAAEAEFGLPEHVMVSAIEECGGGLPRDEDTPCHVWHHSDDQSGSQVLEVEAADGPKEALEKAKAMLAKARTGISAPQI